MRNKLPLFSGFQPGKSGKFPVKGTVGTICHAGLGFQTDVLGAVAVVDQSPTEFFVIFVSQKQFGIGIENSHFPSGK